MNESKECGTCGNNTKDDVCMIWDTGLKVTEAGICSGWKPIPVATTDAPMKTMLIAKGGATDGQWVSKEDALSEIAKRDDLIRRMAEWILRNRTPSTWTIPLTPGPYEIDIRRKIIFNGSNVLLSEANELMGVK